MDVDPDLSIERPALSHQSHGSVTPIPHPLLRITVETILHIHLATANLATVSLSLAKPQMEMTTQFAAANCQHCPGLSQHSSPLTAAKLGHAAVIGNASTADIFPTFPT